MKTKATFSTPFCERSKIAMPGFFQWNVWNVTGLKYTSIFRKKATSRFYLSKLSSNPRSSWQCEITEITYLYQNFCSLADSYGKNQSREINDEPSSAMATIDHSVRRIIIVSCKWWCFAKASFNIIVIFEFFVSGPSNYKIYVLRFNFILDLNFILLCFGIW